MLESCRVMRSRSQDGQQIPVFHLGILGPRTTHSKYEHCSLYIADKGDRYWQVYGQMDRWTGRQMNGQEDIKQYAPNNSFPQHKHACKCDEKIYLFYIYTKLFFFKHFLKAQFRNIVRKILLSTIRNYLN